MKNPAQHITILTENGFKVHVHHLRPASGIFGRSDRFYSTDIIRRDGATIEPRGGQTIVEVVSGISGRLIARGIANCSKLDNYNKKLGLSIALGRALKDVPDGPAA